MSALKFLIPCILAGAALTGCVSGPPSPAAQAAAASRQAASDAKIAKALEGKVAGTPVNCINLRDIRSMKPVGNGTLLYEVSKKLIYRNDPYGGCPGLEGRTLVTRTFSNQLCRGDIATVADLAIGFEMGSCAMNSFVPYRTPG